MTGEQQNKHVLMIIENDVHKNLNFTDVLGLKLFPRAYAIVLLLLANV